MPPTTRRATVAAARTCTHCGQAGHEDTATNACPVRLYFATLCEAAERTDLATSDHAYAAAFRDLMMSHALMPRRHSDALMRGAFARFWSMRLSTALQIGNARMARYWMRQLGYDPAADYDALHLHTPHDLAEILDDWHDDEAYMFG